MTSSVNSPYAISYWCSIGTESLPSAIFEIMGPNHDLDLSRSRDVIGHVTNWIAICNFLLVSHCNRTSSLWPFLRYLAPKPCAHTQHTDRHMPHILSHAMYCIGQRMSWSTKGQSRIWRSQQTYLSDSMQEMWQRETGRNQGFKWVSIERKWNQNIQWDLHGKARNQQKN